ncbi:uncharacterized protein BDR25DRAFT_353434 [Lindgomyces ingoldianus]|uniref:Uncharacterized protein n=1 Tax=Lindgomyces ingoldianus TaxID=673940 RepID=A0ACB6QZJ0_9PLEO|nr:uncharacterized protein BDR25DRAFT_353434 [Lindgomyces ingoldianus]KAF2472408.1 hypothetical protein BDR25DRAFT_353434 [Lindgomyces ingoldianus]
MKYSCTENDSRSTSPGMRHESRREYYGVMPCHPVEVATIGPLNKAEALLGNQIIETATCSNFSSSYAIIKSICVSWTNTLSPPRLKSWYSTTTHSPPHELANMLSYLIQPSLDSPNFPFPMPACWFSVWITLVYCGVRFRLRLRNSIRATKFQTPPAAFEFCKDTTTQHTLYLQIYLFDYPVVPHTEVNQVTYIRHSHLLFHYCILLAWSVTPFLSTFLSWFGQYDIYHLSPAYFCTYSSEYLDPGHSFFGAVAEHRILQEIGFGLPHTLASCGVCFDSASAHIATGASEFGPDTAHTLTTFKICFGTGSTSVHIIPPNSNFRHSKLQSQLSALSSTPPYRLRQRHRELLSRLLSLLSYLVQYEDPTTLEAPNTIVHTLFGLLCNQNSNAHGTLAYPSNQVESAKSNSNPQGHDSSSFNCHRYDIPSPYPRLCLHIPPKQVFERTYDVYTMTSSTLSLDNSSSPPGLTAQVGSSPGPANLSSNIDLNFTSTPALTATPTSGPTLWPVSSNPNTNANPRLTPGPFTISSPLTSPTPNASASFSVMDCSANPRSFAIVQIHTAKCAICDSRNMALMRRCPGCTYQVCQPCFNARGTMPLYHGNLSAGSSMGGLPVTPVRRLLFGGLGAGSGSGVGVHVGSSSTPGSGDRAAIIAGSDAATALVISNPSGNRSRSSGVSLARDTPMQDADSALPEISLALGSTSAHLPTSAAGLKTSKRGRVLKEKAPVIDDSSDAFDDADTFECEMSSPPTPAPKRRKTATTTAAVAEKGTNLMAAREMTRTPTPKKRRSSKTSLKQQTAMPGLSSFTPLPHSDLPLAYVEGQPDTILRMPSTVPSVDNAEPPECRPLDDMLAEDMIEEIRKQNKTRGYRQGQHILGRYETELVSNPVIQVPELVRRKFKPRPRAEEIQKNIQEKVKARLEAQWEAEHTGNVSQIQKHPKFARVCTNLLVQANTGFQESEMASSPVAPAKPTVRAIVQATALRLQRDISLTAEQEKRLLVTMNEAARKMTNKFYDESAEMVRQFIDFSVDMPTENLGSRQVQELTQAVEEEGARIIKNLEAAPLPTPRKTAPFGGISMPSPGPLPPIGFFTVSPTKSKHGSSRDRTQPRRSPLSLNPHVPENRAITNISVVRRPNIIPHNVSFCASIKITKLEDKSRCAICNSEPGAMDTFSDCTMIRLAGLAAPHDCDFNDIVLPVKTTWIILSCYDEGFISVDRYAASFLAFTVSWGELSQGVRVKSGNEGCARRDEADR